MEAVPSSTPKRKSALLGLNLTSGKLEAFKTLDKSKSLKPKKVKRVKFDPFAR